MSDDAEFDAFLKGDDALSRRLQAIDQAGPSAALDAAILQRARDLMAQEARPEAANDAGVNTPAPRIAGLGWRWRVPGAIAATVLAGVFAHQAYQASADMERSVGMPAEETAIVQQPPVAADAAAAPEAPAKEVMADARQAAPVSVSREKVMSKPAPAAEPAPAPATAMHETSDGYSAGYSAAPPPPSAPAPVQQVQVTGERRAARSAETAMPVTVMKRENEEAAKSMRVEVTGSRIKALASDLPPDEWFAVIEDMLDKGKGAKDKEKAVLAEWRKFRKMYPYYPVSEAAEEQIKALEK